MHTTCPVGTKVVTTDGRTFERLNVDTWSVRCEFSPATIDPGQPVDVVTIEITDGDMAANFAYIVVDVPASLWRSTNAPAPEADGGES